MSDNLFNIDDLLNNALKREELKDLFDKKLLELKLNKTNVQAILGISYRTLDGILDGTQKLVDVTNLVKLSDFLQIPKEKVFQLYLDSLQKKFHTSNSSPQKIKYIKDNFNLPVLKKAGLIHSLTNFDHIEKRINARLGFKSIYEYKKPNVDVAFSSGLFKPKNLDTRLFWIRTAICTFEELDNPHEYKREALIKYFPQIRWHTLNEERGLSEVIKALYKIGITVIYQPPLQGLQLRGATFNINNKPCIVLTNYQNYYSTLWFCLLHELYHILFDLDDIKNNSYHLTDDDNEELTVQEREKYADDFARGYLFSSEKLAAVKSYMNDPIYLQEIANENHVHRSIIYAFNAFTSKDRKAWARAKRYSPPVEKTVRDIDYSWAEERPFEEMISEQKQLTYN
ncbi:MAG TPA: hypothetical protein VK543_03870 [Puia sp.]|nr:hypothetical protein [Puia sp.]